MQQGEIIIGWAGLSTLTGVSAEALQMRERRGNLPLTEKWERGRRVFARDEVERWLEGGMPKKLQ